MYRIIETTFHFLIVVMNKKTNPWMLTTIFLIGLIIGFGLGRIPFGAVPQQTQPANNPSAITGTTTGTGTGIGNQNTNPTPQPQTVATNPVNSYDNIQKSVDSTGHYSLGNPNAKVKITEFGDFQCPFCYRYFMNTFSQILSDYIATGKVYYTFTNFPLNIHPQASKAAEAALCAGDQNKFWEYHDLLFNNQNLWSGIDNDVPVFEKLADGLGLDANKFKQCLTGGKYTTTIAKDVAAGDKKGVNGTPTLEIGKQEVVGAQDYSVFQKAIDTELKK